MSEGIGVSVGAFGEETGLVGWVIAFISNTSLPNTMPCWKLLEKYSCLHTANMAFQSEAVKQR